MTRWKRLFYYLMINATVSACTTLVVLAVWERAHPSGVGGNNLVGRILSSPTPPPVLSTFQAGSAQTPEATPTLSLTTYQVKEGDTLGDIALLFDVPVNEIMSVNGIDNPDSLGAGMVLFIPVTPTSQPAETPVNQKTPQVTQAPPTSPAAMDARVIITNVFGAGDLTTERVRLERRGEGDLVLANWQLRDESGQSYIFPQLTLFPGGAVDLYTAVGVDDVAALYWNLDHPVWETGEVVTLVNDQGNIQATFTVP